MNAPRTCEECGIEIPANAPEGLCPRCLARMGQSLFKNGPLPHLNDKLERPGTVIGRYKLLEKIGEGGFGVVYMAEQRELVLRKVALKIVKPGMDTREVIARFEAERQALALMDHPNIAQVLDAGATEAGRPYFVMELVRGIAITDYCDQKQLPTRKRLQLFIRVCQAVQHAHQKGVIHRDIKPGNVLITEHDGEPVPKVIDFGVAKALGQKLTKKTLFTGFHQMLGTPAYMSPEQAALCGIDVDTRADIYSLGVLLYELLTGATPFDAEVFRQAALDEIRRLIQETEPPKPSTRLQTLGKKLSSVAKQRHTEPATLGRLVRGDLDWIVMKCLEKDRRRRYETVNGLATDLVRHLEHEPIAARPPSTYYRLQRLVVRNKLVFAAASTVAATMILGLGISTWALARERKFHQIADQAGRTAVNEAQRARASATEVKMTLAAADFRQAVELARQNDSSDAIAYLTRSLSANPTNAGALTRLASLLTHRSWLVPRLLFNTKGQFTAAACSTDGTLVLLVLGDTAGTWDTRDGRQRSVVSLNGEEIHAVQFSPDGRRFATCSENTVRVWDANTGKLIGKPMKESRRISLMEFSPDGGRIVTATEASSDGHEPVTDEARIGSATVWDTETGHAVAEHLQHGGRIHSVRFSHDGKRIVTASQDKCVRVWEAQSGLLATGPIQHERGVLYAEFNHDGMQILSVDGSSAYIWSASGGGLLHQGFQHRIGVTAARFSPDGQRIITWERNQEVRLWDTRDGALLLESMGHDGLVDSAQFSRDGNLILTTSTDYTVFDAKTDEWCKSAQIWDARNGKPVTSPLHYPGTRSALFSEDGKRLVTVTSSGSVLIWEMLPPALGMPLSYKGGIVCAEFSPDGSRIACKLSNGQVGIWDAHRGVLINGPLGDGGRITSAKFSPDGQRIVTASTTGRAHIWDSRTGRLLVQLTGHTNEVEWAEFSPDGKSIVTTSADKTARVWNAQTGAPAADPMVHPRAVRSAHFSPDGTLILTVDDNLRVWHSGDGKYSGALAFPYGCVQTAQFSPDGMGIIALREYYKVYVLESQGGRAWSERTTLYHGEGVETFQISPDSARIVTTAYCNNSAMMWDPTTGLPMAEPLQTGSSVCEAAFSSDGRRLLTVSRLISVWDKQSGQLVADSSNLSRSPSLGGTGFNPDGSRIAFVTADKEPAAGKAYVWDVAPSRVECPGWLLQLAEAVGGTKLDNLSVTEPTRLDRVAVLDQIRRELDTAPEDNDWVTWGRWLLADPATRTISPFSKVTMPEYLAILMELSTDSSLEEAEQLAAGNLELLNRIAQARIALPSAK